MVLAKKKRKEKEKEKKHRWANNASQAVVLLTTKLASIAHCYFSYFTLFFFAFFPHQGAWSHARIPTSLHCSKSSEVMNKINDTFTNLF